MTKTDTYQAITQRKQWKTSLLDLPGDLMTTATFYRSVDTQLYDEEAELKKKIYFCLLRKILSFNHG